MINVIHAGSNAFDALTYPEQHPFNTTYLSQQFDHFSQSLNDAGRKFMEASRDVYERIHSSQAAEMARVAVRAAKGLFRSDQVVPLETLEELQAAQPTMQRWVMAQPDLRQMYHQQRCDGYSDTYVDVHPGVVGEQHYDYRRVMDGVIVEEGDEWVARCYADEILQGDRELYHTEKIAVLASWDAIKAQLRAGRDPSNPYGGKL